MPSGTLKGLKALVTSGPTQEPLDPVRYLTNRSSGKQGHYIAESLAARGAEVTLVSGPVNIPDPAKVTTMHVKTALEMYDQCLDSLKQKMDIAVCAAAVSDWRFREINSQKMKKQAETDSIQITLVKNPDILSTISKHQNQRPTLVIGFAAETEHVISYAVEKQQRKRCDWMLANDVSQDVFGADDNTVYLVKEGEVHAWPTMSKKAVAEKLANDIVEFFRVAK